MPEAATTEFWKHLKPIAEVFKPDAGHDVYMSDVAEAEDKYFVPFSETVSSRPLWSSWPRRRGS